MKSILITQRIEQAATVSECRESLDVRWGELFRELGALPLPALSGTDPQHYFAKHSLSGVLLSGGNSLHGLEPSPENLRRDEFEEQIIALARAAQLPIFGVCRGLQLLVHSLGGELKPISGHVRRDHPVYFSEQSLFARHLGPAAMVNSFHGFGVQTLPESLRATGTADDGSIEAIEHQSEPIAAMMWHPERRAELSFDELDLLRSFFFGGGR